MGTCPTRCQSNMTILDNSSESASPTTQESMIVSLYNYPSFGHTEVAMHIGERLTIVSDDGDFMMVRSTTTGHESYIPTSYIAKVTHRRAGSSLTGGSSFCVCELYLSGGRCLEQDLCSLQWHISLCLLYFQYSSRGECALILLQWLFTGISRYKATELLMQPNNQDGSFLIRESETVRDCYSLSLVRKSNSSYHDCVKHYRISHLQNGWVYISPGLTFPSLHHLVEHYTESADGLVCRLTAPCFIKDLDNTREAWPIPTAIRRPTINWKDISRSVIFRKKRTESDHSLVSEGLREAINSYLQMTEGNDHSWDA